LENLGGGSRGSKDISLVFKALDGFPGSPIWGLLKKLETFRALGDKPKTRSALPLPIGLFLLLSSPKTRNTKVLSVRC
jgi:hypothetical protein